MNFIKHFLINLLKVIGFLLGVIVVCYVFGTILAVAFSADVPAIHADAAIVLAIVGCAAFITFSKYKKYNSWED